LPVLAKEPRLRLLQSLQTLTEVGEFMSVHPATIEHATSKSVRLSWSKHADNTEKIVKAWNERFPSDIDSVQVWDDLAFSRLIFLDELQVVLQKQLDSEKPRFKEYDERMLHLRQLISTSCITLYQRATAAMITVDNLSVADNLIKAAVKRVERDQDFINKQAQAALDLTKRELDYLKIKEKEDEPIPGKVAAMFKILSDLEEVSEDTLNSDVFNWQRHNSLGSRLYVDLAQLLHTDEAALSPLCENESAAVFLDEAHGSYSEVLVQFNKHFAM